LKALAAGGWLRVVAQRQDWAVEQMSSEEARLFIVAGQLYVDAADRDRYLTAVADVARLARDAPGCHDFVQAADPIDAGRINVFERWESDEDLHQFRTSGKPLPELPTLRSADVHKYRISGIEAP
jgi:quinol monooxygenase YgiN